MNAHDAVSRGLGFGRDDSQPLSYEAIQKGGLAYVGLAYDAYEACAVVGLLHIDYTIFFIKTAKIQNSNAIFLDKFDIGVEKCFSKPHNVGSGEKLTRKRINSNPHGQVPY
jgi:hypothetical protein